MPSSESTSDGFDFGPGSRNAFDDGRYEFKSVQALQGKESSARAKWQDQGWEFVSETRGTLRTELNFRRLKTKTVGAYLLGVVVALRRLQPKTLLPVAAAGALILVAGTIGIVVATQGGGDTPSPSGARSERDAQQVLTAASSEDFAALLAVPDYCNETISSFVARNGGRTIEFDGSIADMARYGTRYDILVAPGNKGPESTVGPAFKFDDANVADLNLTGAKMRASVAAGDRFRFVARVVKYNPKQCLLYLDPVSTGVR